MALFKRSLVCFATVASCMGIFIGGEQDVASPLRVAQCRATCLERILSGKMFDGALTECL
ncbi:unnamed protein product, partial [Callosobruchus maculatus]